MSVFRRATAKPLTKAAEYTGLVPEEEVTFPRHPYGFKGGVRRAQGRVYTPLGVFSQGAGEILHAFEQEAGDREDSLQHIGGEAADPPDGRSSKMQRQWQKWSENVIPALLEPYMQLLCKTAGLRNLEEARKVAGCPGCVNGRLLEVSCVFFERLERLVLCTCTEPALQLLNRGLFPCAPSEPSLAVDLNVLDFARDLFVNTAPNTTAWCDTLEGFLNARKFKLKTRNSLRGRFGNALHWYATLINTKNLRMRDYLDSMHDEVLTPDIHHMPVHNPDVVEEVQEDPDVASPSPELPDRPSEYLRERCPLCFGGQNWAKPQELVDAIVCVDACFTQKRRKSQGKGWTGPRVHPETIFIPSDEVAAMEAKVEEARPTKGSNSKDTAAPVASNIPGVNQDYESGMKVPTSVLEECNDSFVAADERRIKASTLFFADTGLMALLCRHDRVLWLVNMTSAGEKQFYVLALLQKLFGHLPLSMRIGVLYDIGCQLDRSCNKYGFLSQFLDRIVFGISVFHAYGHQWPCQIIYHPRKCQGFGLTDGEGCERFWSLIKSLIPSCRVSGYFNQIHIIDTQVKHLDEKSLLNLGIWLKRKWIATHEKKKASLEILQAVYLKGYSENQLRNEWKSQIIEQTKPLKKQSKHLANKEIEEILALMKSVENYKSELTDLEEMIETGTYDDDMDVYTTEAAISDLELKLKKSQKAITNKRLKLSVDGRLNLTKLIGNEFLKLRMNALALKQRIRDRLRHRKFELENLERAYRATVNRSKLENHAGQQLKRKEPGIQALARKYNKLCADLQTLILANKAPKGAISPLPMSLDGLFKLDVDDDIWQDIGLTNEMDDGDVTQVPAWLGNESIRAGIKALLEYDRCLEEERRLIHEKLSMQQWMLEEWAVIITALYSLENEPSLKYEVEQKKLHLLKLCLAWTSAVTIIPILTSETSWGPSLEELAEAREYEYNEDMLDPVVTDMNYDGNISDGYDDMEDIDNAELMDDMEESAILDEYFEIQYSPVKESHSKK